MICEVKGCNRTAYFRDNFDGRYAEVCERCILLFRHPYEVDPELETESKAVEVNKVEDMEYRQPKEKTHKKFSFVDEDGIINEDVQ